MARAPEVARVPFFGSTMMLRRSLTLPLLCAWLSWLLPAAAVGDCDPRLLGPGPKVVVEAGKGEPSVVIEVREPEVLAAALSLDREVEVEAHGVRTTLAARAPATDAPRPEHLAPSFLVDFDTPVVQREVLALRAAHGNSPSLDALVDHASSLVEPDHREFNWGYASRVLEQQRGDSSEYAVVLAALARALDLPARIVVGLLLVEETEGFRSHSHVWVEVQENGAWHTADPTVGECELSRFYLPGFRLQNEGLGYGVALGAMRQPTTARSVRIVHRPPS